LVAFAGAVAGVGAVGTAALATGITFVIASIVGRRMSDSVGQALSGAVGLGLIGLILAMVVQFVGGIFAPAMFHGTSFELLTLVLARSCLWERLLWTSTRCPVPIGTTNIWPVP
jgi:hypothetical protein